MYAIIIATMIAGATVPKVPVLIASYSSLNECRFELVEISKLQGYELNVSPMVSYSVKKVTPEKTIVAFCVKNIESV